MSDALSLAPRAEQELNGQREPLRAFITASLRGLANRPSSFTRPGTSTNRGQLAEFKFAQEGVSLWASITFGYGQDESTVHVEDITVEFDD